MYQEGIGLAIIAIISFYVTYKLYVLEKQFEDF